MIEGTIIAFLLGRLVRTLYRLGRRRWVIRTIVAIWAVGTATAAGDRYFWVEYAVYDPNHRTYARTLEADLRGLGLSALVVRTHAPSGRPLLRVRSTLVRERALVEFASSMAKAEIGIRPLIHEHFSQRQPEVAEK